LTSKVGQADLVFGVRSGFISIGPCTHDTICATLVKIQTQRDNSLTSLYE